MTRLFNDAFLITCPCCWVTHDAWLYRNFISTNMYPLEPLKGWNKDKVRGSPSLWGAACSCSLHYARWTFYIDFLALSPLPANIDFFLFFPFLSLPCGKRGMLQCCWVYVSFEKEAPRKWRNLHSLSRRGRLWSIFKENRGRKCRDGIKLAKDPFRVEK